VRTTYPESEILLSSRREAGKKRSVFGIHEHFFRSMKRRNQQNFGFRIYLCLAMLVISGWSFHVAAEALSVEELREIQAKMKSSPNLTVAFEQDNFQSVRNKHLKRTGRLHYSKPDKFRWIVEKQFKNEWIYDGAKACNYLPDDKAATCYKAGVGQANEIRQIVDLVTNIDVLLVKYNLVKAEHTGKKVMMSLTPRAESSISSVDLHLDLTKNYISYLKLYFKDKNYSTFEFTNPDTKKLPLDLFQIPSGVKVTDFM
jgi:outer membrane lipoprotein-sorting protein